MRTMTMAGAAALALAVPLAAHGPALAETGKVSRYVLSHALDFLQDTLASEQVASLHLAAYSAAAASACGDLVLDDQKFVKHFEKLAHKREAKMSPEKKQHFERHLMLSYGIAVGAFLAEAGQNSDSFCKEAQDFKQGSATVNLWK